MPEKFRESAIFGVVGVGPEEGEIIKESIKPFVIPEREKTAQEIEIIKGILDKMPDFIRKYNGVPVNTTSEQIHFIDRKSDDEYVKKALKEGIDAFFDLKSRQIGVLDTENQLCNSRLLVHELMHLNSFQSLQLKDKKKKILCPRRSGLIVHNKVGHQFFSDIDEAVVEELTDRFDKEYFKSIPQLAKELKQREELRSALIDKNPQDKDFLRSAAFIANTPEGDLVFHYMDEEERKFNELIKNICSKSFFNSSEEVFDVFAKALMSGNLLPLARLVERTLGKGKFRELGVDKIGQL